MPKKQIWVSSQSGEHIPDGERVRLRLIYTGSQERGQPKADDTADLSEAEARQIVELTNAIPVTTRPKSRG